MKYRITTVEKSEYPEITKIWEASVRATHEFLKESDFQKIKPRIPEYLDMVDLFCMRDEEGVILGFLGVKDRSIEMLFIHPMYRGKGVGRELTNFAISEHQINSVEVNEDNPQAVGFYEHLGFVMVGRSETDHSGKPYPLLTMELKRD